MRKIKDILPKPSDAIQAMINGLKRYDSDPEFEVDMTSFGHSSDDDKVCFGCAATCTIQYAFDHKFNNIEIYDTESRAEALKTESKELDWFESAIDDFRKGEPWQLFEYYECYDRAKKDYYLDNPDWFLSFANWKSGVPAVEKYLERLKALGL